MTDTITLIQKLISIPSWVDSQNNEANVGQYIFDYLKSNSNLVVEKQVLAKGRFNVIAKNNDIIDTLAVGHIDTVQPSESWTRKPLEPVIENGNLYGLGSTDMKSGVGVMLNLATNQKLKPKTMFLFYIDEEYDFLGMKGFVKEFKGKIFPKQICSFDGSNLEITNGCRGLIEVTVTLKGTSGHASRPNSGINAIVKSYQVINNLTNWLGNYSSDLGPTALNLAYISGGQFQGENSGELILGKQGNIIADVCRFTLDIRPSRSELTAQKILDFIKNEAVKLCLSVFNTSVRHDLGSWLTPINRIDLNNQTLPVKEPGKTGYIDVQMLWQNFDRIPCFSIGAGNETAHKPDEYVEISKIRNLAKIGKTLLINNI